MAKRFVTLVLVAGLSCSLIGTSVAKHKKQPPSDTAGADFDYFLLTLSWAPDFCASNPKERSSAECDPKQHMGLVVHGLWPQYSAGTFSRFGGNYQNVSVAWQYSWLGWPKKK